MRTPQELARTLIEREERINPGVVELASLTALAVHVEPELLRAVRLGIAAHLDVSVEAALWFSPLVESRSIDGIAYSPHVAEALRHRLRTQLHDPQGRSAVERAWQTTRRLHETISPALALEERVAWLAVSAGEDTASAIEDELAPALAAVAREKRVGVAEWLASAWPRLSPEARRSRTGWLLSQASRPYLGARPIPSTEPPRDLLDLDLTEILADLPDVELGIGRELGLIRLGVVDAMGGAAILVPDTDPRLVEMRWEAHGQVRTELVTIAPGRTVTREVGDGALRLRTARGIVYELEPGAEVPIAPLLARTELFSGLDDASLDWLASRATRRIVDRGQGIFWQDEPADRLFVLAEGEVRLVMSSSHGELINVAQLQPPDVFGQFELLDGGPRFASAEAVTAATIVAVSRDDLLGLLRADPGVTEALVRSACATIRHMTQQVTDLALLSLQGRVAAKLLELADPAGEGPARTRRVTQVELATMVGAARQSVNQVLKSLEARGWIRTGGHAVEILDPQSLRRLAGG